MQGALAELLPFQMWRRGMDRHMSLAPGQWTGLPRHLGWPLFGGKFAVLDMPGSINHLGGKVAVRTSLSTNGGTLDWPTATVWE